MIILKAFIWIIIKVWNLLYVALMAFITIFTFLISPIIIFYDYNRFKHNRMYYDNNKKYLDNFAAYILDEGTHCWCVKECKNYLKKLLKVEISL